MSTVEQTTEESRAACHAVLRTVFPPRSLVWIVNEQYEQIGPTWRVTLVCQEGPQRLWVRRVYRYDVPSGTLHFGGEQPIDDAEFAVARRSGRKF